MKDPRTSNASPWWAEVAHLRTSPETGRHEIVQRRTERGRDHATGAHRALKRLQSAAPSVPARTPASRPSRPRATLVDVAPAHAVQTRAPRPRRESGDRRTVTITGRPDGALPPQPARREISRAERGMVRAGSAFSSPDRLMLWAVALGILMIVASLATASA